MNTSNEDKSAQETFEAFKRRMEQKKNDKEQALDRQNALKRLKIIQDRKSMVGQLKRLQRYLGLSGATNGTDGLADDDPVVFISIDVEAFEFNQDWITEVGLSALRVGGGVAAGGNGEDWRSGILSFHFCSEEHRYKRNKVYVQDCREKFHFGNTVWAKQAEVVRSIRAYIEAWNQHEVILVAHGATGDIEYLKKLGLGSCLSETLTDCIDTSDVYRTLMKESHQSALSDILIHYGITGRDLHNAGNDARYTLEAMLAMALDASTPKPAEQLQQETERRIERACHEAKTRAIADMEGWIAADKETAEDSPDGLAHVTAKLNAAKDKSHPKTTGKPHGNLPSHGKPHPKATDKPHGNNARDSKSHSQIPTPRSHPPNAPSQNTQNPHMTIQSDALKPQNQTL